MADFCKQCSIKMFDQDFKELSGLIPEGLSKQGFIAEVIYEGCGPTMVDHDGNCQYSDCLEKGHKPAIVCPVVEAYKARRKSDA